MHVPSAELSLEAFTPLPLSFDPLQFVVSVITRYHDSCFTAASMHGERIAVESNPRTRCSDRNVQLPQWEPPCPRQGKAMTPYRIAVAHHWTAIAFDKYVDSCPGGCATWPCCIMAEPPIHSTRKLFSLKLAAWPPNPPPNVQNDYGDI